MKTNFGSEEFERYARQIAFQEIGPAGQEKLARGRVMILGCGGLGAASASILARAGVGYLKLVDRDFLELNNLQRQLLYEEHDVKEGLPKAIAAQHRIQQINSTIGTEAIIADANRFNIESLINDVDVIIDATDNFETRFLLNEACVKHSRPWIYGAAIESYGLTMTILPGETACLRCVMEKIPEPGTVPTCETVGVLASIVAIIASIQSAEAIKIIIGNKAAINRNLISIDVWQNSYQTIDIAKEKIQKNCPVCNQRWFDYLEGKHGSAFTTLCGRNAVQILPFKQTQLDLPRLAIQLAELGVVKANEYLIRFEIENYELSIFPDGRAIVKGTTDTAIARSLYSRYVGN
ncbi:MAG: ThiF family adenylyltransferase [candidate division KSB1 bacterium]|nr:ThiF family adenylyltransferase [candidate division KSB1 bacterium]MDZ7356944.1 ThiF family adenylyltransferase [candidate division KSB1 bacterium]